MIRSLLIIFILVLPGIKSVAQSPTDLDSLFKEAQEMAFKKEYLKSRSIARSILNSAPEYTDANILIGRTFAWDKEYDSARQILTKVIDEYPSVDAYYALAQLEYWSGDIKSSVAYIDQVRKLDSAHIPSLRIKLKLLLQLNEPDEAMEVVNYILSLDKNDKAALALLKEIKKKNIASQLTGSYQITTFGKTTPERHFYNLEYLYTNKKSKYIGRLSYVNQKVFNSVQAEIESYLSINKNTYLFLNTGISDGDFFPDYRIGAELFYSFPFDVEASVGSRALFFQDDAVMLYTGQVGKYFKKNWISARVYLQNQPDNVQITGILELRQYLKNSDEYISIILSKGSIPSTPFGKDEILRLDASSFGAVGQFKLIESFLIRSIISYEHEEFMADFHRSRFNLGISLISKF